MQRLFRKLSDNQKREAIQKIKSQPGGLEFIKSLEEINIYSDPGVIRKILGTSVALDIEWNRIKQENATIFKTEQEELRSLLK